MIMNENENVFRIVHDRSGTIIFNIFNSFSVAIDRGTITINN